MGERVVQVEMESPTPFGIGVAMTWVPVARSDDPRIRRVYRGAVLRRCSCGRICSPGCIRCHCGVQP